jgi:peptide/nickel transport system permease protein
MSAVSYRYIFARLYQVCRSVLRAALVMLGVLVIVFLIMRFAPGDPLSVLAGEAASNEEVEALRRRLGLNLPVWAQLGQYLWHLSTGDFGQSFVFRRPAIDVVLEAMPNTILLGAVAFGFSLLIAIPAGIASAVWRDSWIDRVTGSIVLVMQTIPPFWGAIVLIFIFAMQLQLLPTSGTGSVRHIILPAVTLAIYQAPMLIKTLRTTMLEALREDYIRTARAKGMGRGRIIFRHALGNAVGPIITVIGLQLGAVLSGAIVTEAVFAWPGLGTVGLGALRARDYPLAQAVVATAALMVVVFNLFADVLVGMLDPRIRDSAAAGTRAGK